MTFEGFFPASVLIFETQVPTDRRLQWDFSDSLPSKFIGLRMGSVGLISVLSDGGVQNELLNDLKDFQKFPLHPLQFAELMTKIRYKSLLLNRTPKYILIDGDPIVVMQTPIQGLSNTPIFNKWDNEIYAKMLSSCTGIPIDDLYEPSAGVRTWIKDKNGKALYLPCRE